MNSTEFRNEVSRMMQAARANGSQFVDITSGTVHRSVGGYPGPSHNMPSCCEVMYSMMKSNDELLYAPPKGKGATLKIRYFL